MPGPPRAPGSAWQAAVMSFLAFSVGAILPLFPWFFAEGSAAVIASVMIGAIAALALGAAIGFMSGRNVLGTAVRQLLVAAIAATVTYGVGHLLGVSTTKPSRRRCAGARRAAGGGRSCGAASRASLATARASSTACRARSSSELMVSVPSSWTAGRTWSSRAWASGVMSTRTRRPAGAA